MQLVTVQLTQGRKGALEVVQVFQAVSKGMDHLLAMGFHLGIAHDSRGRGQVPKVFKEPLGPRVDNQQPKEKTTRGRWKLVPVENRPASPRTHL